MACRPLGPDPNELAKAAESAMLRKLRKDPNIQDARIETFTLVRKTGRRYTGLVDATINGQPQRFRITVTVLNVTVNGTTVDVTWEPIDERVGRYLERNRVFC
jgi:hypothetical protein